MQAGFSAKRFLLWLVASVLAVVALGAFFRAQRNFQPHPRNSVWVLEGMSRATVHEMLGPPNGGAPYQAGVCRVEIWSTDSGRFEAAFDGNGRVRWKKHYPH